MHAYGQFVHPLGCKILSVACGSWGADQFLMANYKGHFAAYRYLSVQSAALRA